MSPEATPPPRIRATLMLCDYVAASEGKLYISGGGWTVTNGGTPHGIALLLAVPWDLANNQIEFRLRLLTEDGQPVTQQGPFEQQRIEVGGQFEVGRPPGTPHGTSLDVPLAINLPPLALPPGARYSWELSVNGGTREEWHLSFATRSAEVAPDDPTHL